MERIKAKSIIRPKIGKEVTKKIRKEGFIPAVIYSKDYNISVKLPHETMHALGQIHFSESTVIDMEIEGMEKKETIPVLIKDIQYNPLTEEVIHIDFVKVSLEERIRVNVPIELKGECKGVKEGGILEQMLWEIEIEALPLEIPEKIELDVSNLEIGHSIHIRDLTLSPGIRVFEDPQATIVTVVAKEEEEEGVEKGIPGEEEKEPEVIKEKDKAEDKSKES